MKITNISIENFKSITKIDFEIQSSNIFVWPNNSGKTSILQAIRLWDMGRRAILENKATFLKSKKQRFGIGINVQSLSALPVKTVNEIFRDQLVIKNKENTRIKIKLEYQDDIDWWCEIEFYFSNTKDTIRCDLWESCSTGGEIISDIDFRNRKILFEKLEKVKLAYLQPMTAINKDEEKLENWAIYTRLASWNTAWVLRNLCYKLFNEKNEKWELLKSFIKDSFMVQLADPVYNLSLGTIELHTFTDKNKKNQMYQLTSLWRWCLQSILLFAFILDNNDSIVLLDEPDAHLENFKQKWLYNKLIEFCKDSQSQIFLATHSESIMNEWIDDNIVWVRWNKTHNLTNQHSVKNFKKILSEYWVDKYYNVEKYLHIIYLEWLTDKRIITEFAKKLWYADLISRIENTNDVYFDYAWDNVVGKFKSQFYSLKEVVGDDLKWLAIYDRDPDKIQNDEIDNPQVIFWKRREIENYFFYEYVILDWLKDKISKSRSSDWSENLFMNLDIVEIITWDMKKAIQKQTKPSDYEKWNQWSFDQQKASEYLEGIFSEFLTYNPEYRNYIIDKKDYYELVQFINITDIDNDIKNKIDKILEAIM